MLDLKLRLVVEIYSKNEKEIIKYLLTLNNEIVLYLLKNSSCYVTIKF